MLLVHQRAGECAEICISRPTILKKSSPSHCLNGEGQHFRHILPFSATCHRSFRLRPCMDYSCLLKRFEGLQAISVVDNIFNYINRLVRSLVRFFQNAKHQQR